MYMQPRFFEANRRALSMRLKGGLVVMSAHDKLQQRSDMAYRFTQEPNFWYLCGIDEPGWIVVIEPNGKDFLIAPTKDDIHVTFDGATDIEAAIRTSGIRRVVDQTEGEQELRRLASLHSVVYSIDHPSYASHFDFSLNPAVTANKRRLERIFGKIQNCNRKINELRAIKQPEEIAIMKKAINLTVKEFQRVHSELSTYNYEYQIEASFSHGFRSNGSGGHAYEPIVAGGKNACTLHYNQNNAKLKKGLVLLDIGASVGGYAADITRTYSYGEPSKRQRQVHRAVENAHVEIIRLLRPELGVEEYQSKVDSIMRDAIDSLGLGSDDASLRKYFPHAVSHGLGIDVHDSLGAPKWFKENMVLTVEPGIYIPEESIGVRIEDDIQITANGHKNLSSRLSTGL